MKEFDPETSVVLFDGACNLCNGAVQFILERDPEGKFKFASIQSATGRRLMEAHGFNSHDAGTFVLIQGGRVFTRSEAALKVAGGLAGPWPALNLLRLIPRTLRDIGYHVIATNRYRWFGRKDTCMIPNKDVADRFLN